MLRSRDGFGLVGRRFAISASVPHSVSDFDVWIGSELGFSRILNRNSLVGVQLPTEARNQIAFGCRHWLRFQPLHQFSGPMAVGRNSLHCQ